MSVDRKTLRVLLAALDLPQAELADLMGYDRSYVVNVINGFTEPSGAFRRAFGEAIAVLVLGHPRRFEKRYPVEPLLEIIDKRAVAALSRRQFFAELGTSRQSLKLRKSLPASLADRLCTALGLHLDIVYGPDNEQTGEAS